LLHLAGMLKRAPPVTKNAGRKIAESHF